MKSIKGVTLMELLTAISMSVLVLAGLGAVFAGTLKVWTRVQNTGRALREGRTAIQWITTDLREGICDIDNNNRIINFNGADKIKVNTSGGEVEYSLQGDVLNRILNSALEKLATGVTSLKFLYYDKNGAETAELSEINFVSVSISINKGGNALDLKNGANLRNYTPAQLPSPSP